MSLVKKYDSTTLLRWMIVIAILVRLITLGLYPVNDTTEARYAEIARKMFELNDWITPWFDYGVPFWGKPPMSTWLSAASFHIFGVNEFAARLPHFLTALLISWLVWDWLKQKSIREATIAVALIWIAPVFYISSGAVMMDMTLTAGIVLAMRGFWLGLYGDEVQRRRERWLLFIGLSVGLLCKGPIVLVLAGLPIFFWTIATRNITFVWKRLPWLSGSILMILLTVPWYWMAELKTPGFLDYFIVGEHWKRFTVAGWTGDRYGNAHAFVRGSIWFFAVPACVTWAITLPVLAYGRNKIGVLLQSNNISSTIISADNQLNNSWNLYLLLWGFMPCLFFTLSGNILWTYVLPGIPALAMCLAGWLIIDNRIQRTNSIISFGLLITTLGFSGFLIKQDLTDNWKNTKSLIKHYQMLNTQHEGLIFLGGRPYSAAFYSDGKAENAKDPSDLAKRLNQSPAFVALRPRELNNLPPELQARLYKKGFYNEYQLLSMHK